MTESTAKTPAPDGSALARVLGTIVKNTQRQRWLSPRDARQVSDTGFSLLSRMFADSDEIGFKVFGTALQVNDRPLQYPSAEAEDLLTQLSALSLTGFALARGMSRDEFDVFVNLMSLPPEEVAHRGGIPAAAQAAGLDHFRLRKVVLREITEDEVVVAKKEAETQADVAGVLAYLRGSLPSDRQEEAVAKVRDASANPREFARLILQAARAGADSAPAGEARPPPSADVVRCVRRAFDSLMKDPAIKTQQGRKALTRTLAALETDVAALAAGDDAPREGQSDPALSQAVGEMMEELRIDGLAIDYMKRRAAIDKTEQRLLSFIHSRGLEALRQTDLRERLSDEGLAPEDWFALLAKSGALPKPDQGRGPDPLADLLFSLGAAGQESIGGAISQVQDALSALVAGTHQRVGELVRRVQSDESADGGQPPPGGRPDRRPQRQMIRVLAEIVQELCQPLSVISCSLEMIQSRSLGNVSDQQVDMLKLAAESAQKIGLIVDGLREIAGEPDTLSPDANIQASLYQ